MAFGAKMESRFKIKGGTKAVATAGVMTTKTRAGRETAYAANADIKTRRGRDETTQVDPGICPFAFILLLLVALCEVLKATLEGAICTDCDWAASVELSRRHID